MKRILFTAVLLLGLSASAYAQPGGTVSPAGFLSNTTLSAAISSTQTSFTIASASASTGSTFGAPAANQCLYVDLELMQIVSISSTTVTVRRGTVHRSAHASGARVFTGPCNGMNGGFMAADPPNLGGNQDCTQYTLPWFNAGTGAEWWCDLASSTSGVWSVTYPYQLQGNAGSRRIAQ